MLEETGLRVSHVRFLTATNDVMEDDRKHYVTLYVGCTIVGENKEPEVTISLCDVVSGSLTKCAEQVREPHKCEQWEWWTWDKVKSSADIPADVNKNGNNAAAKDDGNLGFTGQRLFLPLSNLFKQQPRFVPAQHYAQVSLGIPRNN